MELTIGFLWPPSNPSGFPGLEGGLRIEADDVLVTGVANEEVFDARRPRHDYSGTERDASPLEFPGRRLEIHLGDLFDAVLPYLDGTAERYGETVVELTAEPGETAIVVSNLDDDLVRVAAKPRRDDPVKEFPEAAMLGAAVEPVELARAVIDAHEQAIEYVERAYSDAEADFSDDIADLRTELEERIDELEATIEREESRTGD